MATKGSNDDSGKDEVARFTGVSRKKETIFAQHRKLTVPSSDVGTYDFKNPAVTPDASSTNVTIANLEELYFTEPLTNKAINIKASRLIGDGFELLPSDVVGADPLIAEQARDECWDFLKQINYITFFKQAAINAYVAGNEWTEIIYNRLGNVISANHGDFRTIDYRRDMVSNKILLDDVGEPVGFWQYLEDIGLLYQGLSTLYGSKETLENLEATQARLKETESEVIVDEYGREIAVVTAKPLYLFLNENEIVHLSFSNLNDNWYGTSMILPAYNSIVHLKQVLFATAEYIDETGYPKAVLKIGDSDHQPDENMNNMAQDMVLDPVRKEAFVIPYYADLSYLQSSGGAVDVNSFPDQFITMVSTGLGVPRELLVGEGDSNRATAMSNSSDFEKIIESDRRILEEYIMQILNLFLSTRHFKTSDDGKNIYIPRIKWPKFITEDEKVRKEMIRADWESGAITFNEYRELLGYNEIEDSERGEKYYDEMQSMGTGFLPQMNAAMSEDAQFRMDPKSELNPAINNHFRTENVDYKDIAQSDVGTKIKSVGEAKARQIRDTLVNGLGDKRVNLTKTREEIQKIGNYKPYEAQRIIRTELSNVKSKGREQNARDKGLTHKKWQAVLDGKTSNLSKALDGQVRKIDEDFEVTYTDESGKRTTWKGQQPPEHPNTRCQLVYFAEDPGDLKRFEVFSEKDLNKISEEIGDQTHEDFTKDRLTKTLAKRTGIPKSKIESNYFDVLSLGLGKETLGKIFSSAKLGAKEIKQFQKLAKSVRGSPRKVKNLTDILTSSVKNKRRLTKLMDIMGLKGGSKK